MSQVIATMKKDLLIMLDAVAKSRNTTREAVVADLVEVGLNVAHKKLTDAVEKRANAAPVESKPKDEKKGGSR